MNVGRERLPCDPVRGRELTEQQSILNAEVLRDVDPNALLDHAAQVLDGERTGERS